MRRTLPSLLALAFATSALRAQSAPPPPPPELSGTSMQISGTIERFLINPNGDIDGILLTDGTQVPTPPPLSAQVGASLHAAQRVRISGIRVGTLPLIAQAQVFDANGHSIVNGAVPPPPPPPSSAPTLAPMIDSGVIERLIYAPRGGVAGVLLDDGTILRMPRPAVDQVSNLLQPGSTLSARGFGVQSPYGRAIEVTALGRSPTSEQTLITPRPRPRP
jgi:hypothetical protein